MCNAWIAGVSSWPEGTFGLPMPKTGCPVGSSSGEWETGKSSTGVWNEVLHDRYASIQTMAIASIHNITRHWAILLKFTSQINESRLILFKKKTISWSDVKLFDLYS